MAGLGGFSSHVQLARSGFLIASNTEVCRSMSEQRIISARTLQAKMAKFVKREITILTHDEMNHITTNDISFFTDFTSCEKSSESITRCAVPRVSSCLALSTAAVTSLFISSEACSSRLQHRLTVAPGIISAQRSAACIIKGHSYE